MLISRIGLVAFLFAGLISSGGIAKSAEFDRLLVFGDSLSDTGNDFVYSDTFFSGLMGVTPPPQYFIGNFSNGPTWVQHLSPGSATYSGTIVVGPNMGTLPPSAGFLLDAGLFGNAPSGEPALPTFDALPGASSNINFAHGGATTSPTPFTGLRAFIKNLGQQLDDFESGVGGGQIAPLGDRDLVTLWAGANDFLNVLDEIAMMSPPPDPAEAIALIEATAATAVANMDVAIDRLSEAGAKRIIVPNLPPLGATPAANGNLQEQRHFGNTQDTQSLPPDQRPPLPTAAEIADQTLLGDIASAVWDAALAELVANKADQLEGQGVVLVYLDVDSLFEAAIARPERFGFSDAHNAACAGAPVELLRGVNQDCEASEEEQNQHIFWDEVHPTTRTHELLAQSAQALLEYADPSAGAASPVASAWPLFEVGALASGAVGRDILPRLRDLRRFMEVKVRRGEGVSARPGDGARVVANQNGPRAMTLNTSWGAVEPVSMTGSPEQAGLPDVDAAPPERARFDAFVAGNMLWGDRASRGTSRGKQPGFDFGVYTFSAGGDYLVTDDIVVGALLGYGFGQSRQFGSANRFDYNFFQPTIYGLWNLPDLFSLNASFGYGWHSYDNIRRDTPVNGLRAQGDTRATSIAATVGIGRVFGWRWLVIEPGVELRVLNVDVRGYDEAGAANLNLRFQSEDVTSVRLVSGLSLGSVLELGPLLVSPQIRLKHWHEFGNGPYSIRANLASGDPSPVLAFRTAEPDRNALIVGGGVGAAWGRFSGMIDFETDFLREHAQDFRLTALASVKF